MKKILFIFLFFLSFHSHLFAGDILCVFPFDIKGMGVDLVERLIITEPSTNHPLVNIIDVPQIVYAPAKISEDANSIFPGKTKYVGINSLDGKSVLFKNIPPGTYWITLYEPFSNWGPTYEEVVKIEYTGKDQTVIFKIENNSLPVQLKVSDDINDKLMIGKIQRINKEGSIDEVYERWFELEKGKDVYLGKTGTLKKGTYIFTFFRRDKLGAAESIPYGSVRCSIDEEYFNKGILITMTSSIGKNQFKGK